MAVAVLAAGVLVLAAYVGGFNPRQFAAHGPPAASAPAAGHAARSSSAIEQEVRTAPVAVTTAAVAPAPASTCPTRSLTAVSGPADGQFNLEPALSARAPHDPAAFLAVAREAANQGHVRDAEVALMAACHVAERTGGAQTAQVADIKTQLGQHYTALAAHEAGAGTRERLLQRASMLFAQSVEAYTGSLGREASKTRIAEQQLAAVREPQPRPSAAPVPQVVARRAPTTVLGAARPSMQDARVANRQAAQAVVVPSLIRADPQLQLMEADMQRLRAQAARVSRDRAGLSRRDAYALAQREAACHDKSCLMRWYAQRRRQLLAEF